MYEFSEKFRVYRFRKHYSELLPAEFNNSIKNKLIENFSNVDLDKPLLIICPEDIMKQAFLFLFMKLGFVDYKVMSAYTLLDIYLGNNEDVKTPLDIEAEVLCFYLGYGEFENKRQGDVLIQVINNQLISKKKTWIFAKSSVEQFKAQHFDIYRYFQSNKYTIVEVRDKSSRGGEDI